MFGTKRLKGRRIAVLVADGFEKVELSIPRKALRAAGAKVDIVSLRRGRIRGVNLHEPASRVSVTKTVEEANANDYDGLFIPGGLINPDLLRQSSAAREFVRTFDANRKPIASICHGPWVLASAGLLENRTVTSWPGIRDDMVNAGATWLDQEVVRDRHLVTSRGPQDLKPFTEAVIDLMSETSPSRATAPAATESDPQWNEPPKAMLTAMRWIPRPSFRTLLGSVGLALGYIFVRRVTN